MDLSTISLAVSLSIIPHHLPTYKLSSYSKTIQQQSERLNIDPLIIIAIIKHESHWIQGMVSSNQMDYGLMQVRAKFSRTPPERLLIGENNIIVGTYLIKSAQTYCEKKLGREPETEEWLACYQGSCYPWRMCKPTHMTDVVAQYAQCLADSIQDQSSSIDCNNIYKYELS